MKIIAIIQRSEQMNIVKEIEKLEERKEMAMYQRKITTCIGTVMEYDQEISAINRRLEKLSKEKQ